MKCHARLTKWTTRSLIGDSKHYALAAYVCTGTVTEGLLCPACCNRSRTHKKYEQRIHGLLTEPIPESSHIYGGSWYWRQVAAAGEPPADWVLTAKALQAEAEEWVEGAWTMEASTCTEYRARQPSLTASTEQAKPGESTEDKEMASASTKTKAKAKAALKKSEPAPLTHLFPPKLPPLYEETNKPARKMETDEWTLVKGEYKGVPVWILPNGKRFDMDEKGEPRNLIG